MECVGTEVVNYPVKCVEVVICIGRDFSLENLNFDRSFCDSEVKEIFCTRRRVKYLYRKFFDWKILVCTLLMLLCGRSCYVELLKNLIVIWHIYYE